MARPAARSASRGEGAKASSPPAPERAAKKGARVDSRFVNEVAQRHFQERPRRVGVQSGGLSNSVFRFRVSHGEFILRSHDDATQYSIYLKEHWSMEAARRQGIPVPRVLEIGNFADGRAYMIQEVVTGVDGRLAADRLGVLEQLGRFAARLHSIRTHGFGPVFDWSENTLSRHASWAAYLRSGFDVGSRLQTLQKHRMLDGRQAKSIASAMHAVAQWRKRGVLHHGDLRLKNVIVDPATSRIVALIDWDNATSQPGPYWDLSIALHELGIDEKEAFLGGYGMSAQALAAAVPFLRLFNTLNYASAVAAAAQRGDRRRLEWFRLRLAGGLELFDTR
jgi:aminoglycoside phosphotransferase (APT) family kinase protein